MINESATLGTLKILFNLFQIKNKLINRYFVSEKEMEVNLVCHKKICML